MEFNEFFIFSCCSKCGPSHAFAGESLWSGFTQVFLEIVLCGTIQLINKSLSPFVVINFNILVSKDTAW